MPCRHCFLTLIFIVINCATLFHRPNEFEKGLKSYQQANFQEAAHHFSSHYVKNPHSDTTLYYLYNCYKQLSQLERGIEVLEQLVKIGSKDRNVYLNLFYYYRKTARYKNLYELISNLELHIGIILDECYVLTRKLYAEIISGATNRPSKFDPVIFAVSKGYIPLCPDGEFYADDTITLGNFIILLNLLVEPFYPQNFFRMQKMSNRSFLYLPYMRLVHLGIMEFDHELDPNESTPITVAAKAIANLKKRGLLD